jgi:peptidyl-prolyl cis-trans isomerase C
MEIRSANVSALEPAGGVPFRTSATPSLLRRWLREPLLHFLMAGFALFVGYHTLSPNDQREQITRIELTENDLRQMSLTFLAQGRPAPTAEEMKNLVEARVREEILYREALAMGLDKGDTIVKRRLAQKMEFLFEDVAALRDPTPQELKAWFEKNSERFAVPPRASFRHLYFSPDRRKEHAREDAVRALRRLAGQPADSPIARGLGDPFMFQDYYGDRSFDHLASVFGPNFAEALLELTPGSWQGPIESGYGWHLVWVDSVTPRRVPQFEEVEPDVRNAWVSEQREELKRKAFELLRSRYVVVVPDDLTPAPLGPSPAPSGAAE